MGKILYYTAGEVTYKDATLSLRKMGYEVLAVKRELERYDNDERFILNMKNKIVKNGIEFIFSFGYYPDLSRIALLVNVRYISWCFDSPHIILESVTLGNICNFVFLFDYVLYEKYKKQGFDTVYYLPMACNVDRVQTTIQHMKLKQKYQHDVTFLGSMYDDELNFFKQINYLPPYVKGYIDAVMEAQMPILGMDMVGYLMRDDICEEIYKVVKIGMGNNYRECKKEILIHMIQKQITVIERRRLLTVLGEKYNVDHYDKTEAHNLPVRYLGYADYVEQMPVIFATSKINLNITLRSILSGIPLRIIDILGAGGFCITNYQAELMEYFENGKSIVWYDSYEDMFSKVDYYLRHDEERERIAKAGHEIVKDKFTYEHAFAYIWSVLD